MPKLILTRGIPGSGKSTWAKAWVQENPEGRVRVNRDDLRGMVFGTNSKKLPFAQEAQITDIERAIAKTALSKGKDVVVDAMNLTPKFVRGWASLGYPVEFVDFDVNVEAAVARNAERAHPVPEDVIRNLDKKFQRDGVLIEPPALPHPESATYVPDTHLPRAYIFDIDGTLAHIPEGGRSPYDYTRVWEDEVDEAVKRVLDELWNRNNILLMSGRDEECRDETELWLHSKGILYDGLLMRPAGDNRRDATVKRELFDEHVRDSYNVLGVFDDRNQVVQAWRDMGLKCFQVKPGDF